MPMCSISDVLNLKVWNYPKPVVAYCNLIGFCLKKMVIDENGGTTAVMRDRTECPDTVPPAHPRATQHLRASTDFWMHT
jgi:hypothetical protein